MISIMVHNKTKFYAVIFWLILWYGIAWLISRPMLLPYPHQVIEQLLQWIHQVDFYLVIGYTFGRIFIGLMMGLCLGFLCGYLAFRNRWFRNLIDPLVYSLKTIPVATLAIVFLLWTSAKSLSVLLSFCLVFVIIYESVLHALQLYSKQQLKMAQLMQLSRIDTFRYVYMTLLLHHVLPAFKTAIGLCIKGSIAAEVIGLPVFSIGEKLYEAKVYFDMPSLFAYTLVILLVGYFLQYSLIYCFQKILRWALEVHP